MSANTVTQGKVKLKHVTNKLLYIDLSSKWGGYFREEAENIKTNFLIVIFFFAGFSFKTTVWFMICGIL